MLGEGGGTGQNDMEQNVDSKNKDLYTNSPYCMKVD